MALRLGQGSLGLLIGLPGGLGGGMQPSVPWMLLFGGPAGDGVKVKSLGVVFGGCRVIFGLVRR